MNSMMLALIGGHELQPLDDARLLAWQPSVYVIVGTHEHADAIARTRARVAHVKALLPNTLIGVRWLPDDQQSSVGSSNYRTPEAYAAEYFPLHIPGTLLMPDNEAAADKTNAEVYRAVVAWWTRVVRLATESGIALSIGCTPTGNPDYPQYDLIAPLLAAMRDAARDKGIVHWLRPNAYADPDDLGYLKHHLERHPREMARVARENNLPMPPMFLGELGIAWKYDAEAGYKRYWDGGTYADWLCARPLPCPAALYAIGAGVYDERWQTFNVLDDEGFWTPFLRRVPRIPDSAMRDRAFSYLLATGKQHVANWQKRLLVNASDDVKLNVRAMPTRISAVVAQIDAGGTLAVEHDMDGDVKDTENVQRVWHHIRIDGATLGYVRSDVAALKAIETPTLPPVPPPPPVEPPKPPADALYSAWLAGDEVQQLASLHTHIARIYQNAYERGMKVETTTSSAAD